MTIRVDRRSGRLLIAKEWNRDRTLEKRTKQNRRQVKRIDVLPDDALLEIFALCVYTNLPFPNKEEAETWHSLVHVCRKWRSLVFQSPRHLDLQLFCTPKTPAKDGLDVWPALPIVVSGKLSYPSGTDNVIAALGHSNRVCQVDLSVSANSQWENVLAAMQAPFPELTRLRLSSDSETPPIIPDLFLGGSAPSLRYISSNGVPFPPKLLLSTNHLAILWLADIPHSGYISPESMVALISVLSSLEALHLGFQSPQSRPDWQGRSLPPPIRSIIPALKGLHFHGVTEYLEDLVTHIDTPQLDKMYINFFNQIDFDCPRLAQFIDRTQTLRALDEARVEFDNSAAYIKLQSRTSQSALNKGLKITISCREPDWQLSSIEQVCNASLPRLSTVEDLYIEYHYWHRVWKDDAIENTLWLELLLPFTTVKNLHLSKEFVPGIAATLVEFVGGGITEVLPSLQNIFVEGLEASGQVSENIGRFAAARQLSGHPITVSGWRVNKYW